MSLVLTKEEKAELKKVIRAEMVSLRHFLTQCIEEFDDCEELDDDTDCATYLASLYPDRIYLYFHMYDEDLAISSARRFWEMDTGDRQEVWCRLREHLSPKTFQKIDKWFNDAN